MTPPAWWSVEAACVAGTLLLIIGTLGVAQVVVWLAGLAERWARDEEPSAPPRPAELVLTERQRRAVGQALAGREARRG